LFKQVICVEGAMQAEKQRVGIAAKSFRAADGAHVGRVRLAVSELTRSVDFYTRVLGFDVLEKSAGEAKLGVRADGRVLVELEQLKNPEATDGAPRLGLFHVAYLLPSREALSAFVRHVSRLGVRIGAGDHIYSEAIYLSDPDGLGVEVYADRPRESWPVEERKLKDGSTALEFAAATLPFRFNELPVVTEDAWKGAPSGTRVGHVHMSVGKLEEAAAFYHVGLGMELMTWSFPGALFVSAGGYHHHVGMNTWSAGAPVAGEDEPRLLNWTLVLPDTAAVEVTAETLRGAGFAKIASKEGANFADPYGTSVLLVTEE
jgi:catechol 2,3-dioxygenase